MMILGTDPLLSGNIDLTAVLIVLMKVGIAFAFLLVAVMLMIWFERKLIVTCKTELAPL